MVGKNKYLVGTKSWREEGFYGYYGTQSSVQCVEVTTFHMSSHLKKKKIALAHIIQCATTIGVPPTFILTKRGKLQLFDPFRPFFPLLRPFT